MSPGSNGFESSTNWSGYAEALKNNDGLFSHISANSEVHADWIVPTVLNTVENTGSAKKYAVTWIGADGWPGETNKNLVQTGTLEYWNGEKAVYGAWYEVLPDHLTHISTQDNGKPYVVNPGDQIEAFIAQDLYKTGTCVYVQVDDNTKGEQSNIPEKCNYAGTGLSVEWIQEAPLHNGVQTELTDTSLTSFTDCFGDHQYLKGGQIVEKEYLPTDANALRIALYPDGDPGPRVSTPSIAVPNPPYDPGFDVAYGDKVPPPPK